jgi:2,4-dienoyl-CoA reductase-like NADH-dependent reductase (Old Yellow Enzyme family)/thioredoxin reductase
MEATMPYGHIFSPLTIGGLEMRNRIFLPPHGDRLPRARQLRYLEERVKHGLALMFCTNPAANSALTWTAGPHSPLPAGYVADDDALYPDPSTDEGVRFFDDICGPVMQAQADLAHRFDARCFAQLTNLGSYAIFPNWQAGLSPSGLADEMLGEATHALTLDEIESIATVFGHGAARVQRAGMDGVELSACNGLLFNAFLSPLTNHRTDDYGGSFDNRLRFVDRVLAEMRRRVGADFVLGIRLPADEMVEGGLTPSDICDIAARLRPHLDYVSVGAASEPGRKFGLTVPVVMSSDFPQAVFAATAAALRSRLDIPVLLAGGVIDPDVAEEVLAAGQADMVGLARAHIADPEWLAKVRTGRVDDIRRCTGDNEGCRTRTQFRTRNGGMTIGCTVNAAVGREEELEIRRADETRRVVVVGGGPGGMEAARVATLRGHEVLLLERSDELGGLVLTAALDPRAASLRNAVDHLRRQMTACGVDVRLGHAADADTVTALEPDRVVIATGSEPLRPDVPGGTSSQVVTAAEVLHGRADLGKRVCVVAGLHGHRTPANMAELLADRGHLVEVITERMILGENQDPAANHHTLKRLFDRGVRIHTLTALAGVHGDTVATLNVLTRAEVVLGVFDNVVVVAGGVARDHLLRELRPRFPDGTVFAAGDCLAPRRVAHAVLEGYRAGLSV